MVARIMGMHPCGHVVTEGEFTIVMLTVYESEYCYAVSLGVPEEGVECCSDCVGAGPLGLGVDDEAFVKGGVM